MSFLFLGSLRRSERFDFSQLIELCRWAFPLHLWKVVRRSSSIAKQLNYIIISVSTLASCLEMIAVDAFVVKWLAMTLSCQKDVQESFGFKSLKGWKSVFLDRISGILEVPRRSVGGLKPRFHKFRQSVSLLSGWRHIIKSLVGWTHKKPWNNNSVNDSTSVRSVGAVWALWAFRKC